MQQGKAYDWKKMFEYTMSSDAVNQGQTIQWQLKE